MQENHEIQSIFDASFERKVREEIRAAREKFPNSFGAFVALVEEVGEVAKAVMEENYQNVERELIQVSTMAQRMVTEGDGHVSQLRKYLNLDGRLDAARVLPTRTTDVRPTNRCVYISGPMTGIADHNFPAFNQAEEKIRSAFSQFGIHDFKIINPARLDSPDDPPMEWADYLRRDIRVLMECDSIFLLNDWHLSKGAMLEMKIATALGFKVFEVGFYQETAIDFLVSWARSKPGDATVVDKTIGSPGQI